MVPAEERVEVRDTLRLMLAAFDAPVVVWVSALEAGSSAVVVSSS